MKVLLLLLFSSLFCASIAQDGCSLHLDGSSFFAVDRFVDESEPKGILFEPSNGGFEIWIKPSNESLHTAGVILQTGIIWSQTAKSFVLRYDYVLNAVIAETWTKTNEIWSALVSKTTVALHPNVWTHVAFDTKSAVIFINGQAALTMVTHSSQGHPPCRFAIGTNFTGNIDDLRVWNKQLSASHVASNMKTSLCTGNSDLALYFSFDECQGNVSLDTTASHACGRLSKHHRRPGFNGHQNSWKYGKWGHGKPTHEAPSGEKHRVPLRLVATASADTTVPHILHANKDSLHPSDSHNSPNMHGVGHGKRNWHNKHNPLLKSIVYDLPPIAVAECLLSTPSNTTNQCPYPARKHTDHHKGGDSSESHSDDDDDDDDSEDEYDFNLFWIFLTGFAIMSCVSCCCRRIVRRKKVVNNHGYQVLPTTENTDNEGYPGVYSAPQPTGGVPHQQIAIPLSPQYSRPVQQPYYDPRMFYAYHMPQMQFPHPHPYMQAPHLQMPNFYSPNQPWGAQEDDEGKL